MAVKKTNTKNVSKKTKENKIPKKNETKKHKTTKKVKSNKSNDKKKTKKIQKIITILIILIILVTFAYLFSSKKSELDANSYNDIKISVVEENGRVQIKAEKTGVSHITEDDLKYLKIFFEMEGVKLDNESLRNQTIIRNILYSNAEIYAPSDEEVEAQNEAIFKQIDTSKDSFLGKLLDEKGITLEEFKKLSLKRLKQDSAIQNYLNVEILPYVEKEEAVEASHIVICFNGTVSCSSERTREEAKEIIEEIKSQLKLNSSKENFAVLATKYSDGPTGPKGGYLGTFNRGVMVSEFEDAAFNLGDNEYSDVVETSFGYHIIMTHKHTTTPNKKKAVDLQYKLFEQILVEATK